MFQEMKREIEGWMDIDNVVEGKREEGRKGNLGVEGRTGNNTERQKWRSITLVNVVHSKHVSLIASIQF